MKLFIYIVAFFIFCSLVFMIFTRNNEKNKNNRFQYKSNCDAIISVWYLYQMDSLDAISRDKYNFSKITASPDDVIKVQKYEIEKNYNKGKIIISKKTLIEKWARSQKIALSLLLIAKDNDLEKVNVEDLSNFTNIVNEEKNKENIEEININNLSDLINILDEQEIYINKMYNNEWEANKVELFFCEHINGFSPDLDPFDDNVTEQKSGQKQESYYKLGNVIQFNKEDFLMVLNKIPIVKEQKLSCLERSKQFILLNKKRYWLVSFYLDDLGVEINELKNNGGDFTLVTNGIRKEGDEKLCKTLKLTIGEKIKKRNL